MVNWGVVLCREEIELMLSASPPLVEGMVDPEAQLQPNGIDLTVREVAPDRRGQL